jgi:hypothetical protein
LEKRSGALPGRRSETSPIGEPKVFAFPHPILRRPEALKRYWSFYSFEFAELEIETLIERLEPGIVGQTYQKVGLHMSGRCLSIRVLMTGDDFPERVGRFREYHLQSQGRHLGILGDWSLPIPFWPLGEAMIALIVVLCEFDDKVPVWAAGDHPFPPQSYGFYNRLPSFDHVVLQRLQEKVDLFLLGSAELARYQAIARSIATHGGLMLPVPGKQSLPIQLGPRLRAMLAAYFDPAAC